jgi:hypothetical protein
MPKNLLTARKKVGTGIPDDVAAAARINYNVGMRYHRDPDGYIVLRVPIDDATAAWLVEVADMSHLPPERIAAAVLRDVREDDQAAHLQEEMMPSRLAVVGGTDTLN